MVDTPSPYIIAIREKKVLLILCCIFLSPLAVYCKSGTIGGDINMHFWINLVLFFLGWGWVHALWYCLIRD